MTGMPVPRTKKCFKCGTVKLLSEFYKHPQMGDGHLNKCKECTKVDVSINYSENREYYMEYERERAQRKERKKAAIRYQRKRRKKYPEKYIAYCAVNNAVRDGRLKKEKCEKCGDVDTQAHHDDYSKPLDVRWLCRKCHLDEHGKEAYAA
jgi:ribosomal protein S27AE